MMASVRRPTDNAGPHPLSGENSAIAAPDLECRVCELEAENTRLRLLVSELLVTNQQLRETVKTAHKS